MRRVPVYTGLIEPRLEFVDVDIGPVSQSEDRLKLACAIFDWNMQWEGGPCRAIDLDELPPELGFLRKREGEETPTSAPSDIVLVATSPDDVYHRWAPLYHLLPRATLQKFGLPIIRRGIWPGRAFTFGKDRIRPALQSVLERAFAYHVWGMGFGSRKSPPSAFSRHEPIKMIAHDLNFWLPHMEVLLRQYNDVERVPLDPGDDLPATLEIDSEMRFELPRKGMEVWTGEAEAANVTRDLIEMADARGQLRGLLDAIRCNRVAEDFSPIWSRDREDFERKLYGRRKRARVSFVEIGDSIPVHNADAELHDGMLYRSLMATVNVKDREVVVCLHKGLTRVKEIAGECQKFRVS